jgi:hypothetical protein
LASREVVVVVVETFVETGVCGRDSGDVIQGRIQGFSSCEMSGPIGARLYAVEQLGRYWTIVGWLQRVIPFGLKFVSRAQSLEWKQIASTKSGTSFWALNIPLITIPATSLVITFCVTLKLTFSLASSGRKPNKSWYTP